MSRGEQSAVIELPWPPSSLSGHNDGAWYSKSGIISKHRDWAEKATKAVGPFDLSKSEYDIRVSATFYPPDRRSDRVNLPGRLKPYWDGIADALKVNDRRFLPTYHFAEPVSNARVVICIEIAA